MKLLRLPLIGLLLVLGSSLSAVEVTLRQPVMVKADRSIYSLKAGTVVELVSREGDKLTIKYNNVTTVIDADRLEEPKVVAEAPKPAEPAPKQNAEKAPPQTTPGKAVDKAKQNVKKYDKHAEKAGDIVN